MECENSIESEEGKFQATLHSSLSHSIVNVVLLTYFVLVPKERVGEAIHYAGHYGDLEHDGLMKSRSMWMQLENLNIYLVGQILEFLREWVQ